MGGNTYPAQTVAHLGGNWSALNFASSGQTTADMIADGVSQVDVQYSEGARRTILIAWSGTNDLYLSASAATTYSRIVAYATARKAKGWRVVILSILPRSGFSTPGAFEANRQSVNAMLLADFPSATAHTNIYTGAAYADYLVDVGADSTIGLAGQESNTTYYTDLVHLTNAGYAIVAAYVKNAISLL